MTLSEYISQINRRYTSGISREHTYRGDLQTLLESLLSNVLVTNEPARIACGAPDFIVTRKGIPVGYLEAKDIGEPLTGSKHKEQFNRYRESLPNIIFTDYLDFHWYKEGEFVQSVRIGEIAGDRVRAVADSEDRFIELIREFGDARFQTIKSASRLSKMMASKARLLAQIIEKALTDEKDIYATSSGDYALKDQLSAFQNVLIHDIDEKEFANIYAQTIAYGMFAARLHDKELDTFSRFEAARLIPKSNPFLRKLFQYIAGYDLDERIDWIVDALAYLFRATDVGALLKDFGKSTQQTDPIIHFYETFLAEFDPKLRKSRGVWYTPEPVVNFIVRAVDNILKTEFGLKDGLADTSKTKVMVKTDIKDKKSPTGYKMREEEVHKVQILDPAAGTGTFLAEVIKQIHKKFEGQQGIWPDYVENHLIPRLNGFEILMASYAMAHLKLDMLLKETGYDRESDQRFRVYLTNSLEEYHPDTGTLFAGWLSNEANEANHIKRDTPVMVVLGNPPYSGESQNKGEWIMKLMEDYKKEPGGKEKLKERNPKWINDDYVKFMRFAQHFIDKNGEGILAFINPHGFLDNPTFRGMRWNLLNTFDKIYTIDLHGNSKKKEVSPDGSPDENVFDIQQGVSINIFIKKNSTSIEELKLNHFDIYGKRNKKYEFLANNNIDTTPFSSFKLVAPNYYFIEKNWELQNIYDNGFSLREFFNKSSIGIQTHRDDLVIDFNKHDLIERITDVFNIGDDSKLVRKYSIKESKKWSLKTAREGAIKIENNDFRKITYRALDVRYIYYNDSFVDRSRRSIGNHINENNLVLNFPKIVKVDWNHCLITESIPNAISLDINGTYFAPLYLYFDNNKQRTLGERPIRVPNLHRDIVKKISISIGCDFTPEKEETEGTFAPIDLLDYIYAVLHSPTYRETYKEFLKIDFPRVPYPDDPEQFWKLVGLGGELRRVHLMEHEVVSSFITTYPKAGSNVVERKLTKTSPGWEPNTGNEPGEPEQSDTDHRYPGEQLGRVWINDTQYFGNVPLKAWEFYIGGYQPAQKWLKDRKSRTLTMEEIQHYQKIVVALMETGRVMGEVDLVFNLENGDN